MTFHVVDYSHLYYCEVLGLDVLPPQRGGKFVLIANHDALHAVFSPRRLSSHHADIVERFLPLQGIHLQYDAETDAHFPTALEWQVLGGGHWEVDENPGTLRLFGRSQAYGGVDLEALAGNLRKAGLLAGTRQVIVG